MRTARESDLSNRIVLLSLTDPPLLRPPLLPLPYSSPARLGPACRSSYNPTLARVGDGSATSTVRCFAGCSSVDRVLRR